MAIGSPPSARLSRRTTRSIQVSSSVHPVLFEALRDARQAGDTTLSGGIRRLAARRLMRAVDVGSATWCDIDTLADLEPAEDLFASQPEPEVA